MLDEQSLFTQTATQMVISRMLQYLNFTKCHRQPKYYDKRLQFLHILPHTQSGGIVRVS